MAAIKNDAVVYCGSLEDLETIVGDGRLNIAQYNRLAQSGPGYQNPCVADRNLSRPRFRGKAPLASPRCGGGRKRN